jgi:hypothetical protein
LIFSGPKIPLLLLGVLMVVVIDHPLGMTEIVVTVVTVITVANLLVVVPLLSSVLGQGTSLLPEETIVTEEVDEVGVIVDPLLAVHLGEEPIGIEAIVPKQAINVIAMIGMTEMT